MGAIETEYQHSTLNSFTIQYAIYASIGKTLFQHSEHLSSMMLSWLTVILLQLHIQPLWAQSFSRNMTCSKPSKRVFVFIVSNRTQDPDEVSTFSSLSQQVLVSSLLLQVVQVKQALCQVWNSA